MLIGTYGEWEICRSIATGVERAFQNHESIAVKVAPEVTRTELIQWVNEQRPSFFLSLHLNGSASTRATGTEVIYAAPAPAKRKEQAALLSASISNHLHLTNRGAKPDAETPHKFLAVLRKTNAPALLIEFGFLRNPKDRHRVLASGLCALSEGIRALAGVAE